MDVLDEGFSQGLGVVPFSDDRRDRGEPGQPRGANPSLPRHQLVPAVASPHHHRLQDSDLPDRACQGRQGLLGEVSPRLSRIRRDRTDGDLQQSPTLRRSRYERRKTPSQSSSFQGDPPLPNGHLRRRFCSGSASDAAGASIWGSISARSSGRSSDSSAQRSLSTGLGLTPGRGVRS